MQLQVKYILDGLFSGLINQVIASENRAEAKHEAQRQRDKQDEWRKEDKEWAESQTKALWEREDQVTQSLWNREDALRAEQHMREDTSYQRSVADAVAAGLSPLAVQQLNPSSGNILASNGSSGSPVSSAPSVGMPAGYTPEAAYMNMDMSSLIGALMSQKNLDEASRHNREQESIEREKLVSAETIKDKELSEQARQFDTSIDEQHSQFMLNYEQRASQYASTLAQQKEFHTDEMTNKDKERAFTAMSEQNKLNVSMGVDFAKSLGMKYYVYPVSDIDQYNKDMSDLKSKIIGGNRDTINDIAKNPDKYLQSKGESEGITDMTSIQGGASFGRNKADAASGTSDADGIAGKVFDSVTRGLNLSANGGYTKSDGSTKSDTWSRSDRALAEQISNNYGGVLAIPVYVRDYDDWHKNYKGKY